MEQRRKLAAKNRKKVLITGHVQGTWGLTPENRVNGLDLAHSSFLQHFTFYKVVNYNIIYK